MNDEMIYSKRGVSAMKEDVHRAIASLDKGIYPGAFCKVLPDIVAGDDQYCNIMHADTAGTKTSLAYIYWKETGDVSVWEDVVQDAIVMNIDDMACVGCVDKIVLSSTIGRNKNLIPGEVLEKVIQGATKFVNNLKQFNINIFQAGGETADVGDIVRTIDIGFTTFARSKRSDLIINNILPGDVIVGLASFGKSSYEESYNSGMGSNGLTSARHDLFTKNVADKYPESFDPNTPEEVIYIGRRKLDELITIPGHGEITIGKLVLSPTRTYLPVVKTILDEKLAIHGMIHCTGGAQTKVMKFVKNRKIIKDNLFEMPPLFKLIEQDTGVSRREMYQVFNMGHRMEMYTDHDTAKKIIDIASGYQIDAQIIGRVEDHSANELVILDDQGEYKY